MWGLLSANAVAVISAGLLEFTGFAFAGLPNPTAGSGQALVLLCSTFVGLAGLLIFGIWSSVLLFRYRTHFRKVAELAHRRQADEEPAASP